MPPGLRPVGLELRAGRAPDDLDEAAGRLAAGARDPEGLDAAGRCVGADRGADARGVLGLDVRVAPEERGDETRLGRDARGVDIRDAPDGRAGVARDVPDDRVGAARGDPDRDGADTPRGDEGRDRAGAVVIVRERVAGRALRFDGREDAAGAARRDTAPVDGVLTGVIDEVSPPDVRRLALRG